MARAFFSRARSVEAVCSMPVEPVAAIIARTKPGRRNRALRSIVNKLACARHGALFSSDEPLRGNLCRHSDRVNERDDLTLTSVLELKCAEEVRVSDQSCSTKASRTPTVS